VQRKEDFEKNKKIAFFTTKRGEETWPIIAAGVLKKKGKKKRGCVA